MANSSPPCLGGGMGRRKGLKIPRGLSPCRFESGPRHQRILDTLPAAAVPLALPRPVIPSVLSPPDRRDGKDKAHCAQGGQEEIGQPGQLQTEGGGPHGLGSVSQREQV